MAVTNEGVSNTEYMKLHIAADSTLAARPGKKDNGPHVELRSTFVDRAASLLACEAARLMQIVGRLRDHFRWIMPAKGDPQRVSERELHTGLPTTRLLRRNVHAPDA